MGELEGNYKEIWKRLTEESKLVKFKNKAEFCRIIGQNQSYVKRKEDQNKFPLKWAFIIGEKFNECPNWIFTGKHRPNKCTEAKFAVCLAQWMEEKAQGDKDITGWIKTEIKKTLPEFKEWLKKHNKKI